jgi:hypothetical protein
MKMKMNSTASAELDVMSNSKPCPSVAPLRAARASRGG